MKKKLLVFHTMVAPYRVDFFNNLALHFDMMMCIDRKMDYDILYSDLKKDYHFNYSEFLSTNGFLKTYCFVKKKIEDEQPDIVMVSECGIISLIVILINLLKRKYKVVSIIDDSYDQLTKGRQFTYKHLWAERILVPRFDQVITVEQRVADIFRNKYGKGIAFPIIRDEGSYRRLLKDALIYTNKYIDKYALNNFNVILFVGRFVKSKNINILIDAYNRLKSNNTKLVLVGAGDDESHLRSLCKNNDVIFTGALSGNRLYAWYNIAKCFVLPSIVEPFGAVVNEALMAGCPCIVSERAGSSSLIKEGINGYVFNPLNVEELSEKIRLVLDQTNNLSSSVSIRPSLMQTTFQEEFEKIVNCLDCANYEQ